MSDNSLLGKKTKRIEKFKVEKSDEIPNDKKAKQEEDTKQEKSLIEKEFDHCEKNLITQTQVFLMNFIGLVIGDYTYYCYNNLKEVKNSEQFQIEIRKVLDNSSNYPFFEQVKNFIIERKIILENSEKWGMKWYKENINKTKEFPEKYKGFYVEDFKKLTKEEQDSIFIEGLINYSFDYIQSEEEKFDTSINKDINKKKEIKIEVQNFNLKEYATIILISSFKFKDNITEINLTGNDLSGKACFWLGTVFKYNKHTIKILNLSRCNLDNNKLTMFYIGSMHASEELNKELIYLEKLILKENDKINGENNSDNEYPLSLIMKRFVIKNLNLMNTKIGNEGLLKLGETLLDLLNNNKFILDTLNLYNIGLKNEEGLKLLGDIIVHNNSTLQILILNKNQITNLQPQNKINFFEYFMDKVAESKVLKELLLLKCEIGKNKDDVDIICNMLKKNKNLESLRMFDNLINNEEDFLKILNLFTEYKKELDNNTLKSLDLSKNHCNIRVSEDFLNMFDTMNLEHLDINQNKMDENEKEIFRNKTNNLDKIKIIY